MLRHYPFKMPICVQIDLVQTYSIVLIYLTMIYLFLFMFFFLILVNHFEQDNFTFSFNCVNYFFILCCKFVLIDLIISHLKCSFGNSCRSLHHWLIDYIIFFKWVGGGLRHQGPGVLGIDEQL